VSAAKVYTLEQCCEIVSGATPKTSIEEYWDGDICWATPKDLSDLESHYIDDTPRKITKNGLTSCSASVLPAGSVLFSSRAPIGHVAVNTVPMATNQGFKSFIPKAGVLDAKFLFHWLKKNRAFLESLGNGATFKEVSKATVADQRRIATILDQADALRAKRREALAQLDSLTQSILLDLLRGEKSVSSIPLANIIQDMHQGINTVTEEIEYTDVGRPIIQSKHITQGYLDLSDARFVSESTFQKYKENYSPHVGDMLLCNIGTIGKSIQIGDSPPDFLIAWNLFLIKFKRDMVEPCYCKCYLDHLFLSHYFDQFMTGGTVKFISKKTFSATPIQLPSLELQRQFTAKVFSLESLKRLHRESLAVLDTLFASLQHRAFQGEL
jgi:type I restriction enzyme, S subunit